MWVTCTKESALPEIASKMPVTKPIEKDTQFHIFLQRMRQMRMLVAVFDTALAF